MALLQQSQKSRKSWRRESAARTVVTAERAYTSTTPSRANSWLAECKAMVALIRVAEISLVLSTKLRCECPTWCATIKTTFCLLIVTLGHRCTVDILDPKKEKASWFPLRSKRDAAIVWDQGLPWVSVKCLDKTSWLTIFLTTWQITSAHHTRWSAKSGLRVRITTGARKVPSKRYALADSTAPITTGIAQWDHRDPSVVPSSQQDQCNLKLKFKKLSTFLRSKYRHPSSQN